MFDKSKHPLYPFIDRALADHNYVVVDPIDSDGLIYLTPKDYIENMKTWLRCGTEVRVLHNPNNPKDVARLRSLDQSASTSNDKNNPLYKKGFGLILSKRNMLLSRLKNNWDEIKMISLTNRKQLDLLTFFLRMVIPLSMAKALKDVSGKMWLTYRFIRYIRRVRSQKGTSYLVTYMKLSQLAISRAISKQPLSSLKELDDSYIYPRLSRDGLPKFIPLRDRIAIRNNSERVIRFYQTLFSLYRVIKAPSAPKLSTITANPSYEVDFVTEIMKFFKAYSYSILRPYINITNRTLNVSEWFNFETASPTSQVSWKGIFSSLWLMKEDYPDLYKNLKSWIALTQQGRGLLINKLIEIFDVLMEHTLALNNAYNVFSVIKDGNIEFHSFETPTGEYKSSPITSTLRKDPCVGMLSCKIEPAGKIRVFAMVDVITQNVMRPLHKFLSGLLKSLPNDGTFDQESMVDRAYEKAQLFGSAYCYDLSAATDRLPIIIQRSILSSLFGRRIASLWQAILVHRPYRLPDTKLNRFIFKDDKTSLDKDFYYSTGQPMGALSSFNMLGVTHHMIMQYCAYQISQDNFDFANKVYDNNGWCIAYEILGDDIAIFDSLLASKYLEVMGKLGVPINVKKSVISLNGKTVELAKRTIHLGHDVSAISFKDILSSTPFSQRVAIVDRLTRRKVISLTRASNIVTSFYGEEPVIRKSFLLISMFFRTYTSKQISILDILFFLFLVRKYAKGNAPSQYNISDKVTVELGKVINRIHSGITSYNSPYRSVFSENLWSKHIVEFMSLVHLLHINFFEEVKNKRITIMKTIGGLQAGRSEELDSVTSSFIESQLFNNVLDESAPEAVLAYRKAFVNDVYYSLMLTSPKIFEALSGTLKINEFTNKLTQIEEMENEHFGLFEFDPLFYLGRPEPRPNPFETGNISKFSHSSIEDLAYVMEALTNYERSSDLFKGKEIREDDIKYSPMANFVKIFDKIKDIQLTPYKQIPHIYMTYRGISTYYEWMTEFIPVIVITIKGFSMSFQNFPTLVKD